MLKSRLFLDFSFELLGFLSAWCIGYGNTFKQAIHDDWTQKTVFQKTEIEAEPTFDCKVWFGA